jgi:TPR repeat protein
LRIKVLVKAGKLEKAGNIRYPRFSEVRFPVEGVAGQFDKGIAAYCREKYKTSLKIFEPLALGGEAGASWYLGEMYAKGLGVKTDLVIAEKWYRKALAQGFMPAQESLDELQDLKTRRG